MLIASQKGIGHELIANFIFIFNEKILSNVTRESNHLAITADAM